MGWVAATPPTGADAAMVAPGGAGSIALGRGGGFEDVCHRRGGAAQWGLDHVPGRSCICLNTIGYC